MGNPIILRIDADWPGRLWWWPFAGRKRRLRWIAREVQRQHYGGRRELPPQGLALLYRGDLYPLEVSSAGYWTILRSFDHDRSTAGLDPPAGPASFPSL